MSTYTSATVFVSCATFDEIESILRKAGYGHAFLPSGAIDLSGLALRCEEHGGHAVTGVSGFRPVAGADTGTIPPLGASEYRDFAVALGASFDEAKAAVRALPRGGGWQPIETAPRDGTEILLCQAAVDAAGKRIEGEHWGLFVQVASWWSGEGEEGEWVVYCSLPAEPRLHFEPTHWMPLPELPAAT